MQHRVTNSWHPTWSPEVNILHLTSATAQLAQQLFRKFDGMSVNACALSFVSRSFILCSISLIISANLVCCFEVTAASIARNSPMEVFFFMTTVVLGCCGEIVVGEEILSLEECSFSSLFLLLRLARLSQAVGTWLGLLLGEDDFEDGGLEELFE